MNSTTAPAKAQLRAQIRIRRAALTARDRHSLGQRAARAFQRLRRRRGRQRIGLYLSTASELDTAPLIRALLARGHALFVPAIDPRRSGLMRMVPLRRDAPLRRRRFGILQPVGRAHGFRPRLDLLILPLLGFDTQGHRLGSGGGYYDRWLARTRPRPRCVGYAYSMQQLAQVPHDAWDQTLDAVCTERGIAYFSRR